MYNHHYIDNMKRVAKTKKKVIIISETELSAKKWLRTSPDDMFVICLR